MQTITEFLSAKVSEAFAACGYEKSLGEVKISNRPDLCQFQCNGALAGAKLHKKAPAAIASDVIAKLQGDDIMKNIEMVGAGFINFDVTDEYILKYNNEIYSDENFGIPQCETAETIFLDYGGPNVAKPLHIGHLRSAVIGEALKKIACATGRKTVADVHLGDWGLQIGLVIAEMEERYGDDLCKVELSESELNAIYPFASAKSKDDAEFKAKAQNITALLQSGHEKYTEVWKKIMEISIAGIKANYDLLNVSFDLWYGESDAEKFVPKLIDILNEKNLLEESMGAMVVDVAEDDDKITIPPVIIKKSDNSNIYATTDLATLVQRNDEFCPSEIWYIVDSRQSLHFTQVFRCAKKAQVVAENTELLHLGFGTMNGSDGKPYKTRDGGVMRLSEFYDIVYATVYEKILASKFSDDLDKEEIAKKITVATIKFSDLINHRAKDYVFDLDKFTSFEGKTGGFLLYTVARINSILNKFSDEISNNSASGIYTDSERELLLKLAMSNEVIVSAYNDKAPNYICENAYQIAQLFSKFYHENHIMNEEDKAKQNAWLDICIKTKSALLKHFDLLAIEAVELM